MTKRKVLKEWVCNRCEHPSDDLNDRDLCPDCADKELEDWLEINPAAAKKDWDSWRREAEKEEGFSKHRDSGDPKLDYTENFDDEDLPDPLPRKERDFSGNQFLQEKKITKNRIKQIVNEEVFKEFHMAKEDIKRIVKEEVDKTVGTKKQRVVDAAAKLTRDEERRYKLKGWKQISVTKDPGTKGWYHYVFEVPEEK